MGRCSGILCRPLEIGHPKWSAPIVSGSQGKLKNLRPSGRPSSSNPSTRSLAPSWQQRMDICRTFAELLAMSTRWAGKGWLVACCWHSGTPAGTSRRTCQWILSTDTLVARQKQARNAKTLNAKLPRAHRAYHLIGEFQAHAAKARVLHEGLAIIHALRHFELYWEYPRQ